MADLATLQVRVDAQGAIRTTQQLGDALNKTAQQGPLMSAAMGKTEAQIRRLQMAEVAAYKEAERMAAQLNNVNNELKKVDSSASSTQRTFDGLRTAFGAVVGSQLLREFVQFADSAKQLEGRIKLVTSSQQELVAVQEALRVSAQRTRTNFEDVVQLYSRVARNLDELNRSQGEVIKFSELVGMAVKSSGAGSQEASAALMQLSQALASGVLRGQELNSIMEQTPAIAKAIAEGMGVTVGQLRAMGAAGKLTADEVFAAILKVERKIREDFATAPQTVADAFIVAKNDILQAIGEVDKELGTSSRIATTIRGFGILSRFFFAAPEDYKKILKELQDETKTLETTHGDLTSAAIAAFERQRKAVQDLLLTEQQAYDERYKAWEDEKRNADERKQWEEERLRRMERIAQAELEAAGRARMAAGIGLPRAGAVGATRVGDVMESARRAAAAEERAREIARQQQSFESRVRGAKFGGVDPSRIRTLPLPTPTPVEQDLLDEQLERMKMNEEIAKNFRDNMQRSIGDFFTSFIQTGRVSIQALFQGIGGMGANMAGSGIAAVITGALPKAMGPFGSILAGLGLAGIGSLFGRGRGATGPTAEEKLAQAQGRYASIELLRQQRADEMRQFMEGRTGAASRGVVQSIGTVLQETTASRMIGELVAIRVATRQTADAVRGTGGAAGAGTVVNVTVQGGAAATGQDIGEKVAEAVDRLLGTKVQTLRLTSGAAVVS